MSVFKEKTENRDFWNIVKGIGILAIVLGHSGSAATAFVYLWHVPLFYFVTGYHYNEAKYARDPFGYLGRRIGSTWPKFMLYAVIAVLFHNVLVRGGVYPPEAMYSPGQHVTAVLLAFPYGLSETVMGPLWFVPSWVLAAFLFGLCVWAGERGKPAFGEAVTACAVLCMGALGTWLVVRGHTLQYNLQTSFLCVPLFWSAWMLRRFAGERIARCFTARAGLPWAVTILTALILLTCNHFGHIFFDIKANQVPGLIFYPVTLLGIGFCLSLAASLRQVPVLRRLFSLFGQYSFDIMGMHFLIFKLIDICWVRMQAGPGAVSQGAAVLAEGLAAFPCGFVHPLGPVYRLLGMFVPLGLCLLLSLVWTKVKR